MGIHELLLDDGLAWWYHRRMVSTLSSVVGREEELSAACAVLEQAPSAAVVFRGPEGIGKTTIWEATLLRSGRDKRLLVARPVEAEQRLSLTVLADLLQPIAAEVLPRLPPPQRRAVEAALLLTEVDPPPVDPRTLGAAFVNSLAAAGRERPVLLAIDDFQWLDAASRAAIEFALRRLSTVGASVLLTLRSEEGRPPLLAIDHQSETVTFDLAPLSLGALQRVLIDRLGDSVAGTSLRRVHAISGGNPFYALELARALRDSGPVRRGDDLPIPSDLGALLENRISALPSSTRRALAAAAALAEPRVELVKRAGDLQPALDAGLVRVERDMVRFGHPLLATAAYTRLTPRRRSELHLRLARLVVDREERARHLALGRPQPDGSLAAELENAAKSALARGAPLAAAELQELALDCTQDPERLTQLQLEAARAYLRGGDLANARRLADESVAVLAPGPQRARALLILSSARRDDFGIAAALAEQAWREARGDRGTEALAASRLSYLRGFTGDMQAAHAFALQALERADALPAAAEVATVAQAAFIELHVIGSLDPVLVARGLAAEERSGGRSDGFEPRYILALAMLLEERYDEARAEIESLIAQNEALGYEFRVEDLLNALAVLETHAGRPAVGATAAKRASEIRGRLGLSPAEVVLTGYFTALPAAYLGHVQEAREMTAAGMRAAAQTGCFAFAAEHAHVLGFLEFSLADAQAAVEVLEPVAQRLAAVVPGMHPLHVPLLPNLIEALITLGQHDRARAHLARLEERAHALDSPGALAQATRARALLAAAQGDTRSALAHFEEALREHERSPGPFERGRTLLARGTVLRRARQWRAARESLAAALTIFEESETPLWAEKARAEMARLGGRTSAQGLTPTEQRIAFLASGGRTNREIAAELFVTVRTVETHLTKVYGKLGVRSRTELARTISS